MGLRLERRRMLAEGIHRSGLQIRYNATFGKTVSSRNRPLSTSMSIGHASGVYDSAPAWQAHSLIPERIPRCNRCAN